MTVNVGIGSGNKDRQIQSMLQILEAQKEVMGRGASEQNVYNALEKLVEFAGLGEADQFFTDPSTLPPPQPQPDPQMELAKAQIQVAQMQAQVSQREAETNRQEAQWRHEEKMKELIDKDQRERYKIELDYQRNVPGGLSAV